MSEKLEFGLILAVIGCASTMGSLILLGFIFSLLNKIFPASKNTAPSNKR
ncbi:MAG TPA: hypothetical protein VJC37_08475 [Planctomycetota bacterium]|nr:hypothetical protein [Planctomycetota bacterium]